MIGHYLRSRPAAHEWSERHRPSAADDDFYYRSESIAEYLRGARRRVEVARTDLCGRRDRSIVEGNSPFVFTPDDAPSPARAIVLTHGLTDSPYAVRDLAGFFQRQGFFVLALQLPGHGTRPGDLLVTGWQDWVKSHQHLLAKLCQRFDEVYAGGFSTGATLSIYQALLNPRIRGLFLFAPALGVNPLARLAAPLARLGKRWPRLGWFDVQPDSDCFKYESLPQRAIAEVTRMIRALTELSRISAPSVPVFVAASEQDATLDSRAILDWFEQQTGPRRMLYYSSGQPQVPAFVKRVPSRFAAQRIRSFAHTSLIHSPANPHYGAHGEQRVCAHYYRLEPSKYQRCKAGEEDCLGEMFDETEACQVIRRLTYNPLFEEMLSEIGEFITTCLSD